MINENVTNGDEGEIPSKGELLSLLWKQAEENKTLMQTMKTLLEDRQGNSKSQPVLFRKFLEDEEPWSGYYGQFMHHVNAMKYMDDKDRKEILLASIGPQAYGLLKKLIPTIAEENTTYTRIVETLDRHYRKTVHIVAARYEFATIDMKPGQNYAQWIAEARGLANKCRFFSPTIENEAQAVDERLRDLIIARTPHEEVRRTALRLPNPTLDEVINIATTFEMTRATTMLLQRNDSAQHKSFENDVHQMTKIPQRTKCNRCGLVHLPNAKCVARDGKCYKCNRKGHYARCCRSRNSTRVVHDLIEDDFEEDDKLGIAQLRIHHQEINEINRGEDYPQIIVKLNGLEVAMEYDTGAAVSTVPSSVWNQLKCPSLISARWLRSYTGDKIRTLGRCQVSVELNNKIANLEVEVINTDNHALFGRPWIKAFNLEWPSVVHIKQIQEDLSQQAIREILQPFAHLFETRVGVIKGFKAKIVISRQASPRIVPNRRIPISLKDKTIAEIERLCKEEILEPVHADRDNIEWSTPLVIVRKKDGNIRICADFRVTINPFLSIESYEMPTFDSIMLTIAGSHWYSKIDLRDAYLQMEVSEECRHLLTVSTPLGFYRYRRLPFGLSISPAIFQRYMSNLMMGINGVATYLDDILIGTHTKEEHMMQLHRVMKRLSKANIHIRSDKCVFCKEKIDFLGHQLGQNQILPSPSKITAIQNMERPQNKTQLRSFLGAVSFLDRFLPRLRWSCIDLYNLTGKNTRWRWDTSHEESWDLIKKTLSDAKILVPYNGKSNLKLACDASEYGVGSVLLQEEKMGYKPVAYASRILQTAEKQYSQIDKEALALIFGIRKFHQYIAGRKFIIETDHKPLQHIFGEKRNLQKTVNHRLVRWATILNQYNYTLQFIKGSENTLADMLSRLPQQESTQTKGDDDPAIVHLIQDEAAEQSGLSLDSILSATNLDAELRLVKSYITRGWPTTTMPTHLKAYQSHAQDLSIESGAVMCLGRIVIPSELRKKTLDHIHLGHPGIVAMKSLARTYVWWPKLSEEVEKYVLHCPECQKSRNTPPDYPLQNWPITSSPWERVHVDFAGPVKEQYYLLMQCAASKWPEVLPIASLHAHTVISKMREVFARLGVPAELVSDNGPPFTSALFTTFLKNNNIRHRLTTPYHPKSNGLIERLVQTVKQRVLLRCERGAVNKRLQQFLMSYRNSIHCSTKETPARLMIGRNLSTLWDHIQPARVTAMESQNRQKKYYDRRCKARAFQVGDEVWYRPNNKIKWKSGIIVERTSETTYSVECHGRYIRGHIDQLRRRYRETERQVVSGFDWPAIETSDTTYEKNDKERNSDDATRNDLEQPAENLASTEKIVTETLGSNTDANLQQENGPHNDLNQAMTVLRQSERKRTQPERFGASWPW